MKYLSICSLLFILIGTGCHKEKPVEPVEEPYYVGTAKWEMNGQIWNGVTSAIRKSHRDDTVYALKIYRNSASLNLVFHDFKLKTGNQLFVNCDWSIPDNCMYPDFYYGAGDVIYDFYELTESDDFETYFEITELDLEKNTAKGKFQCKMRLLFPNTEDDPNPSPDTLAILNGSFETLIKTKW